MQPVKFKLKVDLSGLVRILLPIVCAFVALLLIQKGRFSPEMAWILLPIGAYLGIILLHLLLSYVTITSFDIECFFCGYKILSIPISSINALKEVENEFGYMALAKNQVLIRSNNKKALLLSVNNQNSFLEMVQQFIDRAKT